MDGTMQQLSIVAGPLEEGSDLILTCKAYGGKIAFVASSRLAFDFDFVFGTLRVAARLA